MGQLIRLPDSMRTACLFSTYAGASAQGWIANVYFQVNQVYDIPLVILGAMRPWGTESGDVVPQSWRPNPDGRAVLTARNDRRRRILPTARGLPVEGRPEASAACVLCNRKKNRAGKPTPASRRSRRGVRDKNKSARDSAWARRPPGDKVEKCVTSGCLPGTHTEGVCRPESC